MLATEGSTVEPKRKVVLEVEVPARAGAGPPVPQVLHSRALAHVGRSSLLHHGLYRDDETCVCHDHAVALTRDMT